MKVFAICFVNVTLTRAATGFRLPQTGYATVGNCTTVNKLENLRIGIV